jgi:hypothetical protein
VEAVYGHIHNNLQLENYHKPHVFLSIAKQPKSALGVYRSYTVSHTHVRAPLNESSALSRDHCYKINKRPMSSAGFEPTIPIIEQPQTYSFHSTDARIGISHTNLIYVLIL